ncbi:glucosaminidase domain-containing protein [Gallaecimonas kandeliae]|uniref:glucosaminidase domain-containing protein n=1 Tax=Gallaecimonas kandeliae TaxID=3029055 RepID=UPI0026499D8B|nr:glucosaminidase domain-containing protein [Gallaecimonas kandeliae]WKE65322.1 glucosaminidase domain-containing protein [Gallaecimonas kandeliae]
MVKINGSVGYQGKNQKGDVKAVQQLLNRHLKEMPGIRKLAEDGVAGGLTVQAIKAFQTRVMKMVRPDGRVDPQGKTLSLLNKASGVKARPANVSAFIDKTLPAAKAVKDRYGVPISVLMAQAALESGWGRHVKDNAYFGIKAHKTAGATTTFKTTEFVNGKQISISDQFRAYTDFRESALDYGKFLTENPRYKTAFLYKNDPLKFADQLQAAGYATDPQYAKKLKTVITTYHLDDYDK